MMYGPIAGSTYDIFILGQSNWYNNYVIAFQLIQQPMYHLYGDLAYPQLGVLIGGFRNVLQGTREAVWNTEMSSVQEAVEWFFKEIIIG